MRALAVVVALGLAGCATEMPGASVRGPLPSATAGQLELASRLRGHVEKLAGEIGPRDLKDNLGALNRAADYVASKLRASGYAVEEQRYGVGGRVARNIAASIAGGELAGETVVVGAHYDSVPETPGADDNASGVAALLELARLMARDAPDRRVRFVAFANEEPPYYHTGDMGSLRYARALDAAGEKVAAMLSLEMLGYYDARRFTQHYPAALASRYPDTGDFIAFVGDLGSRDLVRRCTELFRRSRELPAEGAALPAALTGVGWSDHWSFWKIGAPAVMVTDTSLFRNARYHEASDTPDTLDCDRMARAVEGLAAVVRALAAAP
jgi:Zn-dependent M28 family amino/carboxypeptidase